ncbi:MAG: DUF222 domain-containing protein, partial [Solirubrobacteraceae bacterium]
PGSISTSISSVDWSPTSARTLLYTPISDRSAAQAASNANAATGYCSGREALARRWPVGLLATSRLPSRPRSARPGQKRCFTVTFPRKRDRRGSIWLPAQNRPKAHGSVRASHNNTNMCSLFGEDGLQPQKPLELLEREICSLAAHLASATCRWLSLIAEFDEREGWAEWGVDSCADWLSWRCGIGLNAAREHTRVARKLHDLPLLLEAFASGELSYCKVRAVTRVASEKTEAQLVELARHATGAQLEKVARQYGRVLQANSEQAKSHGERQQLSTYWDDDGMLVVQGRLAPEDGAALLAALDQAAASVPEETRELGASAVRAQALVVLASGGATAAEVVVHVDVETLTSDEIKRQSELSDGPALPPETVRRLGCDAAVVAMIERDGKPLSVGRRTRVISPALRRALRSRDRGCRFPGCTHNHHLHAHHIQHWARGGSTEIGNLVQLCSQHHKLVHEGGYRVQLVRDTGLEFLRPDGRVIPQGCEARPAAGADITAQHSALGMSIGPDTCRPLSAGDRLDYDIAVGGLAWYEFGPGAQPELE